MFPAHAAGAALLLLRLCVAGLLLQAVVATDYGLPFAAKAVVLAPIVCLLCLGLFTPVVCAISVVIQVATLGNPGAWSIANASVNVVLCVCLLLLGPGAYSLDGRRYGRRIIIQSDL
jgi:hypothetical protein